MDEPTSLGRIDAALALAAALKNSKPGRHTTATAASLVILAAEVSRLRTVERQAMLDQETAAVNTATDHTELASLRTRLEKAEHALEAGYPQRLHQDTKLKVIVAEADAAKWHAAWLQQQGIAAELRQHLLCCFDHFGKEIARLPLNESAELGIQALSHDTAKLLDKTNPSNG